MVDVLVVVTAIAVVLVVVVLVVVVVFELLMLVKKQWTFLPKANIEIIKKETKDSN